MDPAVAARVHGLARVMSEILTATPVLYFATTAVLQWCLGGCSKSLLLYADFAGLTKHEKPHIFGSSASSLCS